MKKLFKQIWHWLRCEYENGNPTTTDTFPYIKTRDSAKYSELI